MPTGGTISEAAIREWTRTLDRLIERSDRSEALGRDLVEQRALNLDLQRQIHRLQAEIRILRDSVEAKELGASGFGSLRKVAGSGDKGGHRLSLLRRLIGG